jgi:hypothetical protein
VADCTGKRLVNTSMVSPGSAPSDSGKGSNDFSNPNRFPSISAICGFMTAAPTSSISGRSSARASCLALPRKLPNALSAAVASSFTLMLKMPARRRSASSWKNTIVLGLPGFAISPTTISPR